MWVYTGIFLTLVIYWFTPKFADHTVAIIRRSRSAGKNWDVAGYSLRGLSWPALFVAFTAFLSGKVNLFSEPVKLWLERWSGTAWLSLAVLFVGSAILRAEQMYKDSTANRKVDATPKVKDEEKGSGNPVQGQQECHE
jgi:hypothetical protein